MLSAESAAMDFVRDAFGHLKALALDGGGRLLFAAATTRQWGREKSVRLLA